MIFDSVCDLEHLYACVLSDLINKSGIYINRRYTAWVGQLSLYTTHQCDEDDYQIEIQVRNLLDKQVQSGISALDLIAKIMNERNQGIPNVAKSYLMPLYVLRNDVIFDTNQM